MEPLQTLPGAGGSFSGQNSPTLGDKVRFLSCPATYSCAPGQLVARETHMSWIFLAGDRVYKLKKPVRFPYLDFSTLDRRAAACRAEYLLNRRLAPDIYLDVVPLTISRSGLAIAGARTSASNANARVLKYPNRRSSTPATSIDR